MRTCWRSEVILVTARGWEGVQLVTIECWLRSICCTVINSYHSLLDFQSHDYFLIILWLFVFELMYFCHWYVYLVRVFMLKLEIRLWYLSMTHQAVNSCRVIRIDCLILCSIAAYAMLKCFECTWTWRFTLSSNIFCWTSNSISDIWMHDLLSGMRYWPRPNLLSSLNMVRS